MVRNTKVEKLIRIGKGCLLVPGRHVVVEDSYVKAARRVADNERLGLVWDQAAQKMLLVVWLVPGRVFHLLREVTEKRPSLRKFQGSNYHGAEMARRQIQRLQDDQREKVETQRMRALASAEMGRMLSAHTHHQYDDHPALKQYLAGKKWVPITDDEEYRVRHQVATGRITAEVS